MSAPVRLNDPEPKYGLAVTGVADPRRLIRNYTGRPGLPLPLSKPLGTGVLNSRHKAVGEVFAEAVESMADEGPWGPSEKGLLPR